MKVYVVMAYTMEPYESYEWPVKVFSSEDSAQEYVYQNRDKVFDQNLSKRQYGYSIGDWIELGLEN